VEKNTAPRNVEKSFEKFLDPDQKTADFPNSINSSLSIATASFHVKLPTDEQTDKRQVIHNLPCRANEYNG